MSSESSAGLTGVARMTSDDNMMKVSHSTTTTKYNHHNNHTGTTRNNKELLWELDEFQGGNDDEYSPDMNPQTFRFSWNEILALFFLLLSFAIGSIIIGVAAGVSISIHYYESPENLDQRRIATVTNMWDDTGRVHTGTPTVTRFDPAILTYSTNYDPFVEERVAVHTDASTGIRMVLNVVVESPSLLTTTSSNHHNHHSNGPSFTSQSNSTQSDINHNDDHSNRYHRHEERLIPPTSGPDHFDIWLRTPPKLCSDSKTMGYDSWTTLRSALNDINRYSAHQSDRWIIYFAARSVSKTLYASLTPSFHRYTTTTASNISPFPQRILPTFDDDRLYYEEQFVLTICPGTFMKAGPYPLIIDTESLTVQCEGCTISGGDSHISFGSSAKNVVIRGITFQSSLRSSILLQQNGAEVTFQDCTWLVRHIDNDRRNRYILPGLNEIANVNSNSILNFYRCSTVPQQMSRFFSFRWWPTSNDS
jgi:hypothetical protein